jgi:hypothetical protein
MVGQTVELNHRQRATLRAVAAGHAEICYSCEPDLFAHGAPIGPPRTRCSGPHRPNLASGCLRHSRKPETRRWRFSRHNGRLRAS